MFVFGRSFLENPHISCVRVEFYEVAGGEDMGGVIGTDEAGDAEFAGHDGGVGIESALIGDDAAGFLHERDEVWRGRLGDQDLSLIHRQSVEFFHEFMVGDVEFREDDSGACSDTALARDCPGEFSHFGIVRSLEPLDNTGFLGVIDREDRTISVVHDVGDLPVLDELLINGSARLE